MQNSCLTNIQDSHKTTSEKEPVNPFAAPSPVVHRVFVDETLSPEVLNRIKPFQGSSTDDARDWVLSIEDVGRAQGWRVQTHRRAAVPKLSEGAYDWHVVDRCSLPLWEGWRAAFLKMFVKELTLEKWTHLVENRVRLPFLTGLEYSLAKKRICVQCPVPLTPIQVIQRWFSDSIARPIKQQYSPATRRRLSPTSNSSAAYTRHL